MIDAYHSLALFYGRQIERRNRMSEVRRDHKGRKLLMGEMSIPGDSEPSFRKHSTVIPL